MSNGGLLKEARTGASDERRRAQASDDSSWVVRVFLKGKYGAKRVFLQGRCWLT